MKTKPGLIKKKIDENDLAALKYETSGKPTKAIIKLMNNLTNGISTA